MTSAVSAPACAGCAEDATRTVAGIPVCAACARTARGRIARLPTGEMSPDKPRRRTIAKAPFVSIYRARCRFPMLVNAAAYRLMGQPPRIGWRLDRTRGVLYLWPSTEGNLSLSRGDSGTSAYATCNELGRALTALGLTDLRRMPATWDARTRKLRVTIPA